MLSCNYIWMFFVIFRCLVLLKKDQNFYDYIKWFCNSFIFMFGMHYWASLHTHNIGYIKFEMNANFNARILNKDHLILRNELEKQYALLLPFSSRQ